MKNLLRGLAAFIVVILLVSSCPIGPSAASQYDAAFEAAQELYDLGLFQGVGVDAQGNPIFELEREPTRNEAVTMLVRLLGKESEARELPYSAPFVDVAEWAKPYVNYAYSFGLTSGVSETHYGGSDYASATQYLTFVLRALGYSSQTDFSWNRAWELSNKIGLSRGEYDNSTTLTRGDVAIISRNALSLAIKDSSTTLKEICIASRYSDIESQFEIHFLDVGEADSALVICDSHCMLIDGGNVDDSSLIFTYLKEHNITHLDYIVCTHAHEDHVGGLAGALNYATVDVAFCPVKSYDSKPFNSFVKYLEKQNRSITVPSPGDSFNLGKATVQIIGPISKSAVGNNSSIVLRIEYMDTSFLFTGDAEREEELEIIDSGYPLESTLLKVGHHGSDSSTSYPFLYYVNPKYAIISVGQYNSYGHPSEDTLSKLRDADAFVYRTDQCGTIICQSDGQTLTFYTERDPNSLPDRTMPGIEDEEQTYSDGTYVLNTKSHKFHYPDCSGVSKMSENNKQVFVGTREEIIEMGYSPCGICKP